MNVAVGVIELYLHIILNLQGWKLEDVKFWRLLFSFFQADSLGELATQ